MERTFEQLADEVNEIMNRVIPENVNCRCAVHAIPPAIVDALFAEMVKQDFTPVRILKSGSATVVFWKDGSKTVVKCGVNETPDDYDAFTAALAIKIFGNNSRLKKIIKEKTVVQQIKKKKGKE